jgi:hypothetical protein
MVISYNQNPHFKIYYKKLQKQYYNSFHHISILKKIHTTIQTYNSLDKSMFFYIIENMNQTYNKIPCFVEKNPKKIIKNYGISKQNLWFSTVKFLQLLSFVFQNCVPKNYHFFFINSPFLDHPKSHHHDQNQQEFKIQINKIPYPKCLIHPTSCIHPTPLILPLLYFQFCPQTPC